MKFYDTSSLLLLEENLFNDFFVISSITLNELEEIKTSTRKDEDIKAAARHLLHALENNPKGYHTVIYNSHIGTRVEAASIDMNNDAKILACAVYYQRTYKPENFQFITNDLAQKTIASLFFSANEISSIHI